MNDKEIETLQNQKDSGADVNNQRFDSCYMTVKGKSVHTDSLTLPAKLPNTDMSVTAVSHHLS